MWKPFAELSLLGLLSLPPATEEIKQGMYGRRISAVMNSPRKVVDRSGFDAALFPLPTLASATSKVAVVIFYSTGSCGAAIYYDYEYKWTPHCCSALDCDD